MSTISDVKKASIFRACEHKSYNDVALEFEFDKKYKTVSSMKSTINRIFNQVKNEPSKFGVSEEDAHRIALAIEHRQQSGLAPMFGATPVDQMTIREKREFIKSDDIKGLVVGGRNKAAKLINEKLDRISKSKKLLDEVSLGELAKVVGIMVDKAQIIQGQSTENIAILSKNIGAELTPEESLDMVLKMREMTQAEKSK